MAGQHIANFTFKKKDQMVLMSDSSSVRVDEDELSIDLHQLFRRYVLDTIFSYELCIYPPFIFKSAYLLKKQLKLIATSPQKKIR